MDCNGQFPGRKNVLPNMWILPTTRFVYQEDNLIMASPGSVPGSSAADGHQEPHGLCHRMRWYCFVASASPLGHVRGFSAQQPLAAAESPFEL